MSAFEYEDIARFAQQGGTVYFGLLFVVGVIYALWPRHRATFSKMSALPLETDEGDDVQS